MNSSLAPLRCLVLTFAASGLAAAALAAPASAATESFAFTGTPQTWVVPAGVTQATFDIRGAQAGGRATASIPLTPGETVQVNVGGKANGSTGGFNGGGAGVTGGGGATDIRIGGTALTDRVLVAGGGGGIMSAPPIPGGQPAGGGGGGGLEGSMGSATLDGAGGTGGTQTGGGGSYCGGGSGSLGAGGDGSSGGSGGGGGGGGYYGGGSGCLGGGGGGSGYGPLGTQFETGVNSGNGSVSIEYVASPVDAPPEISGLAVSPRTFSGDGGPTKLNRAKSATVKLYLSEDADVAFRVRRDTAKRDLSSSRRAPAVTLSLRQGANSIPLARVLGGAALKPRRHSLTAVATDTAGQRSAAAVTRFRVSKP